MDNNYFKPLANILWKAQGRIDAETGEAIHIGDEVQRLRNICDRLRVDSETLKHFTEQSQPVPEFGAMADALGDALRSKHSVFLTHTTLVDLVRAMLEAAQKQPQPVPEGYAMAPTNLTNDMVRAFSLATVGRWDSVPECEKQEVAEKLQIAFDAMLAAAPKPGGES